MPSMRQVATAFLILAIGAVLAGCKLEPYRAFERPDGLYRVEVWRQPQIFAMPGQSGDAPGLARLVDAAGMTLAEIPVEMVELVEDVDWSSGHAYIKLVVDWDLAAFSPQ
jgi:hypothetical protein